METGNICSVVGFRRNFLVDSFGDDKNSLSAAMLPVGWRQRHPTCLAASLEDLWRTWPNLEW